MKNHDIVSRAASVSAFAFAFFAAFAASAEVKYGTVDMMALVRNHPQYDSNRKLLQDSQKDYEKELDKLKAEAAEIQEQGRKLAEEAQNPMLAQSAKQKLEKDLLSVQQKFVAAQQRLRTKAVNSQEELQKLESRMLKATTEDLHKKIDAFAQNGGYDFIFDKSAAPYAKASYDVTPELLKAMGVDPEKAKKPSGEESK